MLILSTIKSLVVQKMDIKGAYLHGDLEEIYMEQPLDFDNGTGKVYKLIHNLYDLKQSC